jgi:acyl dehydratase
MPVAQRLAVGAEVEIARRHMTFAQLRLYHGPAENNHTDWGIATGMNLKAPVAGGILLLGHVSQGLCSLLGPAWLEGGKVEVKFLDYVCPGDDLVYTAKVVGMVELVELEIRCEAGGGRLIMVGTATAPVR